MGSITKNIVLNFPKTAFVYSYMKSDWEKVSTLEDALNFYHKWHDDMLVSVNPVRKKAIRSIVYPLFSMLTGVSYQSKLSA